MRFPAVFRMMLQKGRPLLLVLGLAIAMLGQYALSQHKLDAGLLLYLCSLPLAVYGMLGHPEASPAPAAAIPQPAPSKTRRVGLIICGLTLATEAALMGLEYGKILQPRQTWVWYLACWAAFAAGLLIVGARGQRPAVGAFLRRHRWELLILLGIMVLAAALRFYDLENIPVGLWGDEGNDGVEALAVLSGKIPTPFMMDWGSTNAMVHQYVNALFFLLFGATPLALRSVAAVAGVLSVFALYLLGREMWGARMGLLSAFLLAVSRWHLNRSRFDNMKIQGLVFEILACLFFLRALRTRRLTDFAWCGLAMGLCLHFYIGLRIVPIFLVVVLLVELLKRPAAFVRQNWRSCLVALVGFIVAFGPLGVFYLREPQTLIGRPNYVLIFNNIAHFKSGHPEVEPTQWNMFKAQAGLTALMFNYEGDPNNVFNWARQPMLDPLTGVLFVLGVAYGVWKWRDRRCFLLLAWLVLTMLFGSVLTVGAPESQRTVGVTPALALLAGLAGERIWLNLNAGRRRGTRLILAGLAGLWLAATAYANIELYFGRQMPSRETWGSRSSDVTLLSRYIRDHKEGYRYYIQATEGLNQYTSILRFVAGEFEGKDMTAPAAMLPARERANKGLIYVFQADQDDLVQWAAQIYPAGELLSLIDPWGKVMYWLYRVEAEEIAAHQGLVGRYYAGAGWQETPTLERRDSRLAFDWPQDVPLDGPFSVEWQGVLIGDGSTRYLTLQTDAPAELWLDGEKLESQKAGEPALAGLPLGLHELRIRAVFPNGGRPLALVWGNSPRRLTPVPSEALGVWPDAPGLLGAYYANAEWSGPPALYQVDPLMSYLFSPVTDLLRKPFSVEWRGTLHTDAAGAYEFATQAQNVSQLWVDETLVVDNRSDNADSPVAGVIELAAGDHALRVRYSYRGGWRRLDVYWTPPGGAREVLPPARLSPARLPEKPIAPTAGASEETSGNESPADSAWTLAQTIGEAGDGPGQLRDPAGLARLADGRLLVADRGNGRLTLFDANGKAAGVWEPAEMAEPNDVEISPAGEIYVLDSGRGVIEVLDGAGKSLRTLGQDWSMYAPRSIEFGSDGTLYVVAAGSNELVIVPPAGAPSARVREQGSGPGQFQQPLGLALDAANNVYVLDTMMNKRVQIFNAAGQWLGEWPLTWAPNSGALGIAYDAADDTLYLTDPAGRVYHYGLEGSLLEEWTGRQLGLGDNFRPLGAEVDSAMGRLYMLDAGRDQILVFERPDNNVGN